ncbi:NAD(P)-dependent oxidoreductase [Alteribacter natronophilus]|uniref:NAD(P)-dependent oxidoreductase n=1 Tax=Alteribacter natronophilus TaxID=2583810 RepID=UPI00110DEA23|nr:NAD(P)-dependent oxidoreductase [Alteribacter natronophilus]TMW72102.1 NAD(P)-dependent oxidoreductase [Alteribacter natronophilus]
MPLSKSIGFIGTGVMGKSMCGHLLDAGYEVKLYTRTREKAAPLLERGAKWCETPGEAAAGSSYVITMVGYPEDVTEVYQSADGIFAHAEPGTHCVDMTTSTPKLAAALYEEGKKRGVSVFDAPVSGGDIGAKEKRLAIMVGGNEEDFDSILPVLECMGTNIVYQGPAGSGQHTKMCNQIAIAGTMTGAGESLAYAYKAGLDPEKVLQSIETGAAGSWTLSNLVPRMIREDYSPGFFIKHFIKDMGIAIEAAEEMSLETPGLRLARDIYDHLAENGGGDEGTQAIIRYYTEA